MLVIVKKMEAFTGFGFGMKDSLTLPALERIYYNSLRDENDEPIYAYKDKDMRWFVRKSIRDGRYAALNQFNKSNRDENVFEVTFEKLKILGRISGKLKPILKILVAFENKKRSDMFLLLMIIVKVT